ncbi:hypothetical protein ISCGN_011583 [Ixodes scapularis]
MPVYRNPSKTRRPSDVLSPGRLPFAEDQIKARSSRRSQGLLPELGPLPQKSKKKTATMTTPPVVVLPVAARTPASFHGLGGKNQPIKARSLFFAAHGKCFQVSMAHKPAGASSFSFKALVTNFRQKSQHLTKGTALGYVEEIQDSAAIAVISEDASPTQNKTITSPELDIDPSLPAPQRRQLSDLLAEFRSPQCVKRHWTTATCDIMKLQRQRLLKVHRVDVLLQIKEDILDRISCMTTRAVLALDIKGAFDNVSHTLVFENLASTGCGPRMYDYVRDFLSNWMATIGIESIRTSTIPIPSKGNRQGSVLSPTFGRQDFLEEVIETMQNYLEAGNLQRAPDKSQLLLLRAGKPIPEEEEGGHPPHRDGGAKYTVDRLVKTTTQVMRMVRRITSHRHGLEESDLIRLTQPLVVSHIACANPYLNLLSRGKGKMDVIIRKGY